MLILDLKDLDAHAEYQLRRDLRKKSIRLRVLKNSLARRVFADLGMDGLSKFLDGPSVAVWGGDGIAELAKEISPQVKTLKKPEIKGGAVDGVVVGPEQVEDITKLPSREVLIGQVRRPALAPAREVIALVSSPASTLIGQLEDLIGRGPAGTPARASRRSRPPDGSRRPAEARPEPPVRTSLLEFTGSATPIPIRRISITCTRRRKDRPPMSTAEATDVRR